MNGYQVGLIRGCAWVAAIFVAMPVIAQAYPVLQYEGALTMAPIVVRPNAVTFAGTDHSICVTDEASRSLAIFDDQGFHRFQTGAISGMSFPKDGSIDAEGNFVYIDVGAESPRTIKRLNFLGEPETYDPELPREGWFPNHLVISRDGGYITLDGSGLLAKHDAATGRLIWKTQIMDPEAEFVDLTGRPAEAPDGRIYIPRSGDRVISVVSGEGTVLTTFGEPGAKRGTLAFPVGITFGPGDEILVLDRMRHRILIFDSSHTFVTEFGRLGYGNGELYHPVAITASPDGCVWIAQGFQGRVQMFRLRDTESIPGTSNRSEPVHNQEGEKQ